VTSSTLLQIEDLSVHFDTDEGTVRAVDGVSLDIRRGEALGLVGESGCGKSVTALSVLRLIPSPPGHIAAGRILFHGDDLLRLPIARLRAVRGRAISMIFQEPMTALSPLHRIGAQLAETLQFHRNIRSDDAWRTGADWLRRVGIPDPADRMLAYPHELSGGMSQRVMIAMALMLDPELVIADEPTTALDVTIQAQVFDLMRGMRRKDTSLLLITHNMGVVWEMCTRVAVMYASEIVEVAGRDAVFSGPLHPYTEALIASIPPVAGNCRRLETIPGQVPSPLAYPAGCRFRDRCKYAFARCAIEHPPLYDIDGRLVRCFLRAPERGRP
jgi:oligopeptide/dipeptide ABC transporter ATP-binding protein